MFWFRHPKPFNQRPCVTQMAARKAQALPDMTVIVVDAERKVRVAPCDAPPIDIAEKAE